MSRFRLRIEDVLAIVMAIALVSFAGMQSVGRMEFGEQRYWDFAFLIFPIALLVLMTASRYAFSPVGASDIRAMSSETAGVFRDWMPFLLFLVFYESFTLSIWNVIAPADRDPALLAWDRRLFGETPSVYLDAIVSPALTNLLTVPYFLHLVLPPVLALVFYRRRDLLTFREYLLAVLVGGLIGCTGYILVPAVGPGVAYPGLYGHTLSGAMYANMDQLLSTARAMRDVFPSLHVGLSTVVLYYSRRAGRRWFYLMLPLVLGNWFSTIYLRYHYFVDVLAGWVTAALAIALSRALLRVDLRLFGSGTRPVEGRP